MLQRLLPGPRDLLLDHCRNKTVLRIALSDTSLARDRLQHSRALNQRLYESAQRLWNVYVDDAGLESNSKDATIDALHIADPTRIGSHRDLARQRFDVIVAFDLLDQLRDPGAFLESVQQLMMPARTELLVDAPSSRRARHSQSSIMGLLRKHNLRIERTHMPRASEPPRYLRRLTTLPARVASRAICRMVPYLGDGALVVATRPWP